MIVNDLRAHSEKMRKTPKPGRPSCWIIFGGESTTSWPVLNQMRRAECLMLYLFFVAQDRLCWTEDHMNLLDGRVVCLFSYFKSGL